MRTTTTNCNNNTHSSQKTILLKGVRSRRKTRGGDFAQYKLDRKKLETYLKNPHIHTPSSYDQQDLTSFPKFSIGYHTCRCCNKRTKTCRKNPSCTHIGWLCTDCFHEFFPIPILENTLHYSDLATTEIDTTGELSRYLFMLLHLYPSKTDSPKDNYKEDLLYLLALGKVNLDDLDSILNTMHVNRFLNGIIIKICTHIVGITPATVENPKQTDKLCTAIGDKLASMFGFDITQLSSTTPNEAYEKKLIEYNRIQGASFNAQKPTEMISTNPPKVSYEERQKMESMRAQRNKEMKERLQALEKKRQTLEASKQSDHLASHDKKLAGGTSDSVPPATRAVDEINQQFLRTKIDKEYFAHVWQQLFPSKTQATYEVIIEHMETYIEYGRTQYTTITRTLEYLCKQTRRSYIQKCTRDLVIPSDKSTVVPYRLSALVVLDVLLHLKARRGWPKHKQTSMTSKVLHFIDRTNSKRTNKRTSTTTSKRSSGMFSKRTSTTTSKRSSGMFSKRSSTTTSKRSGGMFSKRTSTTTSKRSSGMFSKRSSTTTSKRSSRTSSKRSSRTSSKRNSRTAVNQNQSSGLLAKMLLNGRLTECPNNLTIIQQVILGINHMEITDPSWKNIQSYLKTKMKEFVTRNRRSTEHSDTQKVSIHALLKKVKSSLSGGPIMTCFNYICYAATGISLPTVIDHVMILLASVKNGRSWRVIENNIYNIIDCLESTKYLPLYKYVLSVYPSEERAVITKYIGILFSGPITPKDQLYGLVMYALHRLLLKDVHFCDKRLMKIIIENRKQESDTDKRKEEEPRWKKCKDTCDHCKIFKSVILHYESGSLDDPELQSMTPVEPVDTDKDKEGDDELEAKESDGDDSEVDDDDDFDHDLLSTKHSLMEDNDNCPCTCDECWLRANKKYIVDNIFIWGQVMKRTD